MGNLCGNERHEPGNAFVSKIKLEVPYRNAKIMVIQGEVLKQQAQVLINAADEPYDTQVMKSFQTLERLQLNPGEAKIQRLNHQGIQFVIQLKMPLDLSDDVERKKIESFLRALELAQSEKMESLIFTDPPFAVVNQKPRDYNAILFLQALVNFLDQDGDLVKIIKIVNMDSETCKSYIDQINRIAINAEMSFKPADLRKNATESGVQIRGETVEIPNHLSPQFKYQSREEDIYSDQQLKIDVINKQHFQEEQIQDEQHKLVETEKDVLELLQENILKAQQTEVVHDQQQANVEQQKSEDIIIQQSEQTEQVKVNQIDDEHQKPERFQTVSFDQPHQIQEQIQEIQENNKADQNHDATINHPQVQIQVETHVQSEEIQIKKQEQVQEIATQVQDIVEKQISDQDLAKNENNGQIEHNDLTGQQVSSEKPEQQQHADNAQVSNQVEQNNENAHHIESNVETKIIEDKVQNEEHENLAVEAQGQDHQNSTQIQVQEKCEANVHHEHDNIEIKQEDNHQVSEPLVPQQNSTEQSEKQSEVHQENVHPHTEVTQEEPQQITVEKFQPEQQKQEIIQEISEKEPQQQFAETQLEKNEQIQQEQQQESEPQNQNETAQSNETSQTAESEPQQEQKIEQGQPQQGQSKKNKKKGKK